MPILPTLTNIWLNKYQGLLELRADFNNNRHYAISIKPPGTAIQVAYALDELNDLILSDNKALLPRDYKS